MLNFEVKTRVLNFKENLKKVQDIGAVYKETMNQTDYYFQIGTKKEKIRLKFKGLTKTGEMIPALNQATEVLPTISEAL